MSASADQRLAAGLFDLGLGGLGELRRRDLELPADFAVAQNLDGLLATTDQPVRRQHFGIDLGDFRIEAGKVAHVDHGNLGAVIVIIEPAVRELAVERHLAAFKARADAAARAGRLALAAATAGLAVTAAFAAANALLPVNGTGDVLQFVEFHF